MRIWKRGRQTATAGSARSACHPYLAAFCAAFVAAGDVFLRRPELNNAIGAAIICGGVAWFLVVQTAWFSGKLNIGRPQAALLAAWATFRAIVYMLAVAVPVALV